LPIKEWLTKNVHQYGKMKKPIEILEDVTGEGLNPDHLIAYFEKKYSDIYRLNG
jgi:carboxypeptidase Taq